MAFASSRFIRADRMRRRWPGATPAAPWQIMARVDHPDPAIANRLLLDDLEGGATGAVLVAPGSIGAYGFGADLSAAGLERILDGVFLEGIAIEFDLTTEAKDAPAHLAALLKKQGIAPDKADIRFSYDPLGIRAASGHSVAAWKDIAPFFGKLTREFADQGFRGPFAAADGRPVHAAGGSEAQELAFALGNAVTYLRALEAGGIALDAARKMIFFRLAADADQFLTMAKFRAIRKLWARVEEACGLKPAAGLRLRRNRLAHDDHARCVREHAAHDHRGVRGRTWRRQCDHGAALHQGARIAGRLRAPHCAQHAAHSRGRIQSRQSLRSGRRLRRHRGADR